MVHIYTLCAKCFVRKSQHLIEEIAPQNAQYTQFSGGARVVKVINRQIIRNRAYTPTPAAAQWKIEDNTHHCTVVGCTLAIIGLLERLLAYRHFETHATVL